MKPNDILYNPRTRGTLLVEFVQLIKLNYVLCRNSKGREVYDIGYIKANYVKVGRL